MKCIYPILLLIIALSCDEVDITSNPVVDRKKQIQDSIDCRDNTITPDSAEAPLIKRTGLASGYYKFTTDTTQVSQYIRCIFQDRNGNLWFGTVGDGVCRYDGSTLSYFSVIDGFAGNVVGSIVDDKEGNIWFATTGGVSKYNGVTFTNYTTNDGLKSNSVISLCMERTGTLWVGTYEGPCRFNGKDFSPIIIPGYGANIEIKCIMEDRNGNILLASNGSGVWVYKDGALSNLSVKDGLNDNSVSCILQDKTGTIWFGTAKGLCSYDPEAELRTGSKSFTDYSEKDGIKLKRRILTVIEDRKGYIWISANKGVCKFENGSFTTFSEKEGLTNPGVQSIFEDGSGNLWVGAGAGLFKRTTEGFVNVTKKGPWPKRFR